MTYQERFNDLQRKFRAAAESYMKMELELSNVSGFGDMGDLGEYYKAKQDWQIAGNNYWGFLCSMTGRNIDPNTLYSSAMPRTAFDENFIVEIGDPQLTTDPDKLLVRTKVTSKNNLWYRRISTIIGGSQTLFDARMTEGEEIFRELIAHAVQYDIDREFDVKD